VGATPEPSIPEDSPVSNNGRGLKLIEELHDLHQLRIRPLAITGVD